MAEAIDECESVGSYVDEWESSVGSYFSDEDESDGEAGCNESATSSITIKVVAEPLIRCAWPVDFDVRCNESIYRRRNYTFNAYLSTKVSLRMRDAAFTLQGVIQFEMMQRPSMWPISFRQSDPTDDDIALYFFPLSPQHEPHYDSLVYEMISGDLGMRAVSHNSELLIFPSAKLQPPSGRFQGKFYLWGFFRFRQD